MPEFVEREAAVKIAEKYGLTDGSVLGRHSGLADCIASEIESLPAADVTPVIRATWVFTTDLGPSEFYHCSRCGREEVRFGKLSIDKQYPYCHCGAKMDGGADDDTDGNV